MKKITEQILRVYGVGNSLSHVLLKPVISIMSVRFVAKQLRQCLVCEFLPHTRRTCSISCTGIAIDKAQRDENTPPADTEESKQSAPSTAPGFVIARRKSLSLPTVSPPSELQTALKKVLSRYHSRTLTVDGQLLAKHLVTRAPVSRAEESRRRKGEVQVVSGSPWTSKSDNNKKGAVQTVLRYGKREAIAFAAGRLQAVYGTTLRVFSEIARREPSFKPEALLDFGSGLGTAVWAAHQLWSDSLYEYQCIDSSQEMGELAKSLRSGGKKIDSEVGPTAAVTENIKGVYFRQYLPVSNKVLFDVVVSAFTLAELPTAKLRRMTLASLWRKTSNFLVLIEHGDSSGFDCIAEAREMILKHHEENEVESGVTAADREHQGGYVFAPCPHDGPCPVVATKSKATCHFAQRVQLAFSEINSPLKSKGFHIENFSYVVLRKGQRLQKTEGNQARLLKPVKKRTRHIVCRVCRENGKADDVVLTKSKHRDVYKEARRSQWGDVIELPDDVIVKSHEKLTEINS